MAMASGSTEVKRQASEIAFYETGFVWELGNLRRSLKFFRPGEAIESDSFRHSETPDICWWLKLYPAGEKKPKDESEEGSYRDPYDFDGDEEDEDEKEEEERPLLNLCVEWEQSDDGVVMSDEEEEDERRSVDATIEVGPVKFSSCMISFGKWLTDDVYGVEFERKHLESPAPLVIKAKVAYKLNRLRPMATLEPVQTGPANFAAQFLKPDFADVRLKVGKRHLLAHRVVLATVSPVFHRMFSGQGWSESTRTAEGLVEVEVADVCPSAYMAFVAVRHFLAFVYTGKFFRGRRDLRFADLLGLAERYDVAALKARMEAELGRRVNVATFARLARLAHLHNARQLLEACRNFLWAERESVSEKDLSALARAYPELILHLFK